MPNNRRGFGGIKYVRFEDANDNYHESLQADAWPTASADVPVGGIWLSGNDLKVVAPTGSNLISNGGFESGNTGWTIPGGITNNINTNMSYVEEGVQSFHGVFTNSGSRVTRTVTTVVGHRYQVKGYVYPIIGVALMRIEEAGSNTIVGFDSAVADPNNPGFAELSFDFVATSTSYTLGFGVHRTNDEAYFDNFSVYEVS